MKITSCASGLLSFKNLDFKLQLCYVYGTVCVKRNAGHPFRQSEIIDCGYNLLKIKTVQFST